MQTTKPSRWFLIAPVLVAMAFLVFYPPIVQDESYHTFADERTLLGIPNFWNVVSNVGFLVVGIMGLRQFKDAASRVMFAGVLLTAIGSSYYHSAPGNSRLVWDRLPMTVVFMSLLSVVVGLWFGTRLGQRLLIPSLVFGLGSIVWWRTTGDPSTLCNRAVRADYDSSSRYVFFEGGARVVAGAGSVCGGQARRRL
jgi:ABC-type sugar transport system permease subunit